MSFPNETPDPVGFVPKEGAEFFTAHRLTVLSYLRMGRNLQYYNHRAFDLLFHSWFPAEVIYQIGEREEVGSRPSWVPFIGGTVSKMITLPGNLSLPDQSCLT